MRKHSGLLGLAGTVFFGILSVYFYIQQREYVEVSYKKSTVRIVESASLTPSIQVIDKEGEPITSDVFVSEITMWNSGRGPIGQDIVRESVAVAVSNGTAVIDARIAEQTHPNIAGFRLLEIPADPRVRQLTWNYFDPGFGLKLIIITAGENEPSISIDGHILGLSEFVELPASDVNVWTIIVGIMLFGYVWTIFIVVGLQLYKQARQYFAGSADEHNAVHHGTARRVVISLIMGLFIVCAMLAFVVIGLYAFLATQIPSYFRTSPL